MELRDFIIDKLGNAPTNIQTNKWVRFSRCGNSRQDKSCWLIYKGEIATFGDWKTDEKWTWVSELHTRYMNALPVFQQKAIKRKQREEEKRLEQESMMYKLDYISDKWSKLVPYLDHFNTYLMRKKILAVDGMRQNINSDIFIPMYNEFNTKVYGMQVLMNIPEVCDNGKVKYKKNAFNSVCSGSYFKIGSITTAKTLYFVEGYADGFSLFQLLKMCGEKDYAVIICFGKNYEPVLVKFKVWRADAKLIIVADNDNAGRASANNCRSLVHDVWLLGEDGEDINDLWCTREDMGKSIIENILKGK